MYRIYEYIIDVGCSCSSDPNTPLLADSVAYHTTWIINWSLKTLFLHILPFSSFRAWNKMKIGNCFNYYCMLSYTILVSLCFLSMALASYSCPFSLTTGQRYKNCFNSWTYSFCFYKIIMPNPLILSVFFWFISTVQLF